MSLIPTRVAIGFLIGSCLALGFPHAAMSSPTLGTSCEGTPGVLCGAVRWVSFQGTRKAPVSRDAAIATVEAANTYFKPCGIAFQLEVFDELDPVQLGLPLDLSSDADTGVLTRALTRPQDFLVVSAGRFFGSYRDVAGVGNGFRPNYQLAALRDASSTSAHVLAHELGHNLGLEHAPDKNNIMYRIENKHGFTSEQCEQMRRVATWNHLRRLR